MPDRPTTEDTPISKTLKPRPVATPTPEPGLRTKAEEAVGRVMERGANYTTGGASGLIQGALKHF